MPISDEHQSQPMTEATAAEHQLALLSPQEPKRNVGSAKGRTPGEPENGNILDMFGKSKPRHIGTGLVKGACSVVQGIGMGAAALVTAPVVGAMNDGFGGFAKGAAAGVAGAFVFPAVGVVAGAKQVAEGTLNTLKVQKEGTTWDNKLGEYVDKYHKLDERYEYKLSELEARRLQEKLDAESRGSDYRSTKRSHSLEDGSRKVVDTEYYEVLDVPTDATANEIRKAYYKMAKECHPDKLQDDPLAKEKFQKIGEAYQVLGDEVRRAQYDQHGKAATEKMEFVDSDMMFTMLFGSDAMDPYIGKLKLASILDAEDDSKDNLIVELEQEVRQYKLAIAIRDRLAPYIQHRKENNAKALAEWKLAQRKIADDLCAQSNGTPIVDGIGFNYDNYGSQYKNKKTQFLGGATQSWQRHRRQVDHMVDAVKAASKASRSAKKLQKKQNKELKAAKKDGVKSPETTTNEDELTAEDIEALEESLTHILEIMLKLSLNDIDTTLRAACRFYVNDRSVTSDDERMLRAEGLVALGKIFQEAALAANVGAKVVDPREQFQEAYIKAAQKMDERQK